MFKPTGRKAGLAFTYLKGRKKKSNYPVVLIACKPGRRHIPDDMIGINQLLADIQHLRSL
ncbi:MAG TPA: hypothetical protein DDX06_10190 [Curvibacter sp.]|nr:hypothetical protein [Curvibacter sp.]